MSEKTAKEMAEKEYQKVVAKAITKLIARKKRLQATNKKDNENFKANIEAIDKEIDGLDSGDITPDESSSFSDFSERALDMSREYGGYRRKILGDVAALGCMDEPQNIYTDEDVFKFTKEAINEIMDYDKSYEERQKEWVKEYTNVCKSYEERQKEWVEKYNVKVGDKVKILRKAEDGEDGWDNVWVDNKDLYVGKIGEIKDIIEEDLRIFSDDIDDNLDWGFPYFVLEKVEEFKVGDVVKYIGGEFSIKGKEFVIMGVSLDSETPNITINSQITGEWHYAKPENLVKVR